MHRTRYTSRSARLRERAVVMATAEPWRMIAHAARTSTLGLPPSSRVTRSRRRLFRTSSWKEPLKAGREPLMVLCTWTPPVFAADHEAPGTTPTVSRPTQNSRSRRGASARICDLP